MVSTQPPNTKGVIRQGVSKVVVLLLMTGGSLFLAAGRLDWLQPWLLVGLYMTHYAIWIPWGLRNNPDLIAERAQGLDKQEYAWDGLAVRLYFLALVLTYVVAGLDSVRYGWTEVPQWLMWVGGALVVGSFALSLSALMNNPYASGVVRLQADRNHQVADRGPYRFVRHPMYAGILPFGAGVPLFLGSYWALIPGLTMIIVIAVRTALEDKTLRAELPGYAEYTQRVRYRLIPGLW